MEMTIPIQDRTIRGYSILAKGITPHMLNPNTFLVSSQSILNKKYMVEVDNGNFTCECPDFEKRQLDCKHIHATKFWLKMKEKIKKEETIDLQEEIANRCIFCYSDNIIKKDKRKTKGGIKQRYLCKKCNKKFVNDPLKRIKGNGKIVSLVFDLYFKGLSFRKIKDHLKQFYDFKISHVTLYKWLDKFTKVMNEYVDKFHPKVSETWHVDEQMVKVKGKWLWNWNLLDAETRFLITNNITEGREIEDARKVFNKAKMVTDRPKEIISDGLYSYEKAIKKEFPGWNREGKKLEHTRLSSIRDKIQNNKIERFHGTFRERDKVVRGFKKINNSITNGYRTYYNFIRPHESLNGLTPSQVAEVNLDLGNNRWFELLKLSSNNGHKIEKKFKPKGKKLFVIEVYKDGVKQEVRDFQVRFTDYNKAIHFLEHYRKDFGDMGYTFELKEFSLN